MVKGLLAVVVAIVGVAFSTALLCFRLVNSAAFVFLVALFLLVALIIFLAERLREFSLRDLSIKLEEIEKRKSEVEALYSAFKHEQQTTMEFDGEKMGKLGVPGGSIASISAVTRYMVGSIKRERERLSRIFAEHKSPETIARGIIDNSMDDKVFKWNGPETPLDMPPKSLEERAALKALKEAKGQG